MVPESANELTSLWGRKLAHNFSNAYGLIGTLVLDTNEIVWLNFGLTKKFQFPPQVQILFEINSNGTIIQNTDDYAVREIKYVIGGDNIGFQQESLDVFKVFFRIYGC